MKNPYSAIAELKIGKISDEQRALYNALTKLWNIKAPHEINVRELLKEASISRSTFYLYYEDLDDLIEDMENYHIVQLMRINEGLMTSKIDPEMDLSYFKETIDYIEDNREFFYGFLIENPNNRFINRWKEAIKYHVLERDVLISDKRNCHLILEIATSEVVAAYTYLLKNPYDIDITCLDKVVSETFKLIEF